AGAGKGPYAGEVGAGHPDAHRAGGVGRGDAEVERVAAGVGDVGRVVEPLAGDHPAEIKTAAGVGGTFDVHALGGAVAVARVGGGVVVVGDALATGVEVLGLDARGGRSGDGPRFAAVAVNAARAAGPRAEVGSPADAGVGDAVLETGVILHAADGEKREPRDADAFEVAHLVNVLVKRRGRPEAEVAGAPG